MLERRRRNRPEGEGSRTAHRLLLTGGVVAALVGGGALAVHAAGGASGTGAGGCFDPAHYGAVPNDGLDDRVPIQAAIDDATNSGGGTVCLAAGRWRVTRAPIGSYDRSAALSAHGATWRSPAPDRGRFSSWSATRDSRRPR